MASGGVRNRGGRPVDPTSARSDARQLSYVALPIEGYQGDIPKFPKPAVKGSRVLTLWEETWRSPQGVVWISEPYRWPIIAEYCLLMREVEKDPTRAALVGQLHRFRDQLGLTPAGLKENGWQISAVPVAVVEPKEAKKPTLSGSRARVLKAVGEK